VRRRVAGLRAGDHAYADGTVFNSLCSAPLPVAADVFATHLETNTGDNRIFPGVWEAERRVTAILGELLGEPGAVGGVVSGGTEANFLALAAAVRAFRARRPGARPELLAGGSIHFSFEKAAALLGVRLTRARLDARFRVDPADLRRRVGERTALIVATAGSSECGAVDDVPALAEVAAHAGVPLHVDAATGGFLVPFARELGHDLPEIGFGLPGVASITVDPHKYGGAPIPAGALLFRDCALFSRLRSESHYRGTHDHWTLLGTRPGAGVLAVYAALLSMGREGYLRQAAELLARRDRFVELLRRRGYALAFPPDLTVVGIDAPDGALAHLEGLGVIASRSRRHSFLRVVVHRHLDDAALERLVDLLDACPRQRRRSCA
jgi:tyrosine decarboxylase MnfA